MDDMHIRRPEDLAAAMREARAGAKLTQAELAKRIGVNREWVVRLESGEPGVGLGLVLRAAAELGLALTLGPPDARPIKPGRRSKRPISIDEVVDD